MFNLEICYIVLCFMLQVQSLMLWIKCDFLKSAKKYFKIFEIISKVLHIFSSKIFFVSFCSHSTQTLLIDMMDIYYHHFVFAKTTSYFIAGGDTRDLYSLVREALNSWCTDVTQSVSFPFLSVELCQSACSSSPALAKARAEQWRPGDK